MSKIFYDHLIELDVVEAEIKKASKTPEEKEELWRIVDDIVNHKALGFILDKLPIQHHGEFLEKFHQAPHAADLFNYLSEKIGENIEELLRQELGNLAYELLGEIKGDIKVKKQK